jgi:hypothetical protein
MLLLFMCSHENTGLIDQPCNDNDIVIKQLNGEFSLYEFIIQDMSNLSCCQYLAIDLSCLVDSDDSLIDAIVATKSMYSFRIIILAIGFENNNPILGKLFAEGIYNIITSTRLSDQQEEISLCLAKGMHYKDSIKHRFQSDTADAVKKKRAFKPKLQTKNGLSNKHADEKITEDKHSAVSQKEVVYIEQKSKDRFAIVLFSAMGSVIRAICYILLFFLSSVGLTVIINSEIRKILWKIVGL